MVIAKECRESKRWQSEKERLQMALRLNKPLAMMYYMKEELTTMRWQYGKKGAEKYLNVWIKRTINSGVKQLVKVGNMIGTYRTAILRWFNFNINFSTGPLEGFNNKIKVLKRKANGFNDVEYFGLKIFDLHNHRKK